MDKRDCIYPDCLVVTDYGSACEHSCPFERGYKTKPKPKVSRVMTMKCDVCGRFVSLDDLASERAIRRLVTPDSHFTAEEYVTFCRDHTASEDAEGQGRSAA
jgi:methionyl-tRNA synthetase